MSIVSEIKKLKCSSEIISKNFLSGLDVEPQAATIVQAKSLCLTFFWGGGGVSPGLVPVMIMDSGDLMSEDDSAVVSVSLLVFRSTGLLTDDDDDSSFSTMHRLLRRGTALSSLLLAMFASRSGEVGSRESRSSSGYMSSN